MQPGDIPIISDQQSKWNSLGVACMQQCLSNAPSTFNRLVKQLFIPHRGYAQTYFDDMFVHSRASNGQSEIDNHIDHLRSVLECM